MQRYSDISIPDGHQSCWRTEIYGMGEYGIPQVEVIHDVIEGASLVRIRIHSRDRDILSSKLARGETVQDTPCEIRVVQGRIDFGKLPPRPGHPEYKRGHVQVIKKPEITKKPEKTKETRNRKPIE